MTLTPSSGFTGAVTLGCTSPVTYVTCTVTSPVTISGTTAGTATITINVAATYGELKAPPVGPERSGASAGALAVLLPFGALLLVPLVRRRKSLRLLAMLAMAAGMTLAFSGCGGGSASVAPSLPPAGAQTVTVTATANSATITTTLTVNISN